MLMRTIQENIKNRKFYNCYLLFGEEEYLVSQYKKKLIQALVAPGDTLNFNVFSQEKPDVNEITDLAETMPFMAEYRVILIEDSELFAKAGSAGGLENYIPNIPETTIMIFSERSVDKRGKLFKAVETGGHVAEFKRQTSDDLSKWILGRIGKENKNITRNALDEFLSRTGTDMGTIDCELEKLLCYCMDKEVIEEKDIFEICSRSLEDHIFDMVDSIATGNRDKAIRIYYDLISLEVEPENIISLVVRQYRILLEIKSIKKTGIPAKDYPAKLKLQNFVVNKCLRQAERISEKRILDILEYAASNVTAIRTGLMDSRIGCELIIFYACGNDQR